MSQGSLIKRLSRRTVVLERLTEEALEAGEIQPGEQLTITIRRVTSLDVTKATGRVPALMRVARLRKPGESDEEWHKRWAEMIHDDPELATEGLEYSARLKEAVLTLGCVAPKVVPSDADIPEDQEDSTLTIADLGPDSDDVYDAIVTFSGLPYRLRAGGGEITTFPEQQGDDRPEPDGALLRADTDAAPQPAAGGVEPGLGDLPG